MTLEREGYGRHKPVVVRCDSCSETFSTSTPDIHEARRRAERAGWVFLFRHRVWVQKCGECRNKEGA